MQIKQFLTTAIHTETSQQSLTAFDHAYVTCYNLPDDMKIMQQQRLITDVLIIKPMRVTGALPTRKTFTRHTYNTVLNT